MGYEFDIVVKALNALKQAKRYNPIGEVQKAIDWINDYNDKKSMEMIKQAERQQQVEQSVQEYQVKEAIAKSMPKKEVPKMPA